MQSRDWCRLIGCSWRALRVEDGDWLSLTRCLRVTGPIRLPVAVLEHPTFTGSNDMQGGKTNTKSTQRRASSQRSRAGCSTCKRRRVKCDETHPRCLRCLRADLVCEGYPDSSTTSTTKLQAKVSARRPLLLPKSSRPLLLSSARPTAILAGETDVENRYLRYFHEQTTCGFQSAFDWTYVIRC